MALLRSGRRAVGTGTYGWLSPGDPDPRGKRLAAFKRALEQLTHIEGFFWDFASLFQVPRTSDQYAAFFRSLPAMNACTRRRSAQRSCSSRRSRRAPSRTTGRSASSA